MCVCVRERERETERETEREREMYGWMDGCMHASMCLRMYTHGCSGCTYVYTWLFRVYMYINMQWTGAHHRQRSSRYKGPTCDSLSLLISGSLQRATCYVLRTAYYVLLITHCRFRRASYFWRMTYSVLGRCSSSTTSKHPSLHLQLKRKRATRSRPAQRHPRSLPLFSGESLPRYN